MASARGNWARPINKDVPSSDFRLPQPGELVWLHRNGEDTTNGVYQAQQCLLLLSPPRPQPPDSPKLKVRTANISRTYVLCCRPRFKSMSSARCFGPFSCAFTAISNDSESYVKSLDSPLYLSLPPPCWTTGVYTGINPVASPAVWRGDRVCLEAWRTFSVTVLFRGPMFSLKRAASLRSSSAKLLLHHRTNIPRELCTLAMVCFFSPALHSFHALLFDENKLDKTEFLDLNGSNAVLMFASF
jgi:hypothetical protein